MSENLRTILRFVGMVSALGLAACTDSAASRNGASESSDAVEIKQPDKASGVEIADALAKALQKANRAVVEEYPTTGHPDGQKFEFKGSDKIQKLVDGLKNGGMSGYYRTGREFYHTILFYADSTEIVQLRFDLPNALRWQVGEWKGDVILSPEAAAAFCGWFAENGYPYFEKWRLDIAEAERAERERLTRFFGEFPQATHQFFKPQISIYESDKQGLALEPARRIVEVVGSPDDAVICVFRAFGVGGQGWNGYDNVELIADSVLKVVDRDAFLRALNQAHEKNDRIALFGACRYFFGNLDLNAEDGFNRLPEGDRIEWAIRLASVAMEKADNYHKRIVVHRLEQFPANSKIREFVQEFKKHR